MTQCLHKPGSVIAVEAGLDCPHVGALEPVGLVAPVGLYSAPLSQLIWALARQRGLRVVEAFVVVDLRAQHYLEQELLGAGAVLDQLRDVLGPELVDRDRFHVRPALLPSGAVLEDDLAPEHGRIYRDTLWRAARDAIEWAGERRVIFGLITGSRLTVTALQTSFFQLLARRQDHLLDVRVADPRIERDTGFYFPEQAQETITRGGAVVSARSVGVRLIELELPRLGRLLGDGALASYDSAQRASQAAIDEATPPGLTVDLRTGEASADEIPLRLSAAELVWYGFLARERRRGGEGWVLAGQDGHAALGSFLRELGDRPWIEEIRTRPLLDLRNAGEVSDEDLRNMRGKTVQKLKRWCEVHRPSAARWLVPEVEGNRRQRLPLPAREITLLGLE